MLFYSGIIDPGIMLKGSPEDIYNTKGERKEKITRIRQLGYVSSYKICSTCNIIFKGLLFNYFIKLKIFNCYSIKYG